MARFPLVPTAPEPERAILVGVEWRDNAWPLDRSLDELERLTHTAGAQCVARLSQRLVKPYPKSFIGSGKVEELCGLVHRMDADVVIFDDDLTPSQQSYLEKAVGEPVKIIDRTALILDIFGLHAQTREGRLQVQLAQLQYLLPRLRGMWSHLARNRRAAASAHALVRAKVSSRSTVASFVIRSLRFVVSSSRLNSVAMFNPRAALSHRRFASR